MFTAEMFTAANSVTCPLFFELSFLEELSENSLFTAFILDKFKVYFNEKFRKIFKILWVQLTPHKKKNCEKVKNSHPSNNVQ